MNNFTFKKFMLIFLFFLSPIIAYSQNGITFSIEELTKPEKLIRMNSKTDIFQDLILSDVNIFKYEIEDNKIDFPYNLIATSNLPDQLVEFGRHSFFNGMYAAYSDHRPFVLSPDMIWLLISQGFARHVNNNSDKLQKYFVDFKEKLSLIVENDKIQLDDPNAPWESVFPEFTKQIGSFIGNELINDLTCNFSTTNSTSKVASEITIMEAMKPYFEYVVFRAVCGIPEITLEGTPEDWQKVLNKANTLRKYELDWWIDEIGPILEEFINASKGDISKRFWRKMFKYHSQEEYGAPNIIDGWIVKFFPYDKDGKKNNLDEIIYDDRLPDEIVKVDLEYNLKFNDGNIEKIPLELWAGFVGLIQNSETFSLKPQIGWMIRKKDIENLGLLESLKANNSDRIFGGISIRVKEFPKVLLKLNKIKFLSIDFINEIQIPDEINTMQIDRFEMSGRISNSEIERICKLLPDTILIINDKKYNVK